MWIIEKLLLWTLVLACPYSKGFTLIRHVHKISSTSLIIQMAIDGPAASYLERMVQRKRIEVDGLLRRHQEPDDPLVMRMTYIASESKFNITNALKRDPFGNEKLHTMSVLVDMKRKSPTIPYKRNIVEFSSAGKFAELLALSGVDAFLINTDELEYGGRFSDIKECSRAIRLVKPRITPPPCINKDTIIHPVQIAQALEEGACGVLLTVAVVGGDLEILLDACTIMGTEAIVEVHTPNELEYALSKGATIFLVNMWDRTTGKLHPNQAKGMASLMPMNAVAIAAGNIVSLDQVAELGFYGYDSIVLGRGILDVPDIKAFIDGVHDFKGSPRSIQTAFGMKGLPWSR